MTSPNDQQGRPVGWRELLAMALVALGFRLLLAAGAMMVTHSTLIDLARAGDGYQFIAYSRAWTGYDAEFAANPYFGRLFPGYPLLIAGLNLLGMPISLATLLPSWLAGAVTAPLAAVAFERRVGWAMATLVPAFTFQVSLMSTEALCLFCASLAFLLWRSQRPISAGLTFGVGAMFRPMIVFGMLGATAADALDRRIGKSAKMIVAAGLSIVPCLWAVEARFGDAIMSARRYATDATAYRSAVLTWPFSTLALVPWRTHVAPWKLVFVGAHLVVVLVGCALALQQWRSRDRSRGELATASLVWLWSNTLFVLCVGYPWGFHDFPRYLVPALPPLFLVYRRYLPQRTWVWLGLGLLSIALAFEPTVRRLVNG